MCFLSFHVLAITDGKAMVEAFGKVLAFEGALWLGCGLYSEANGPWSSNEVD